MKKTALSLLLALLMVIGLLAPSVHADHLIIEPYSFTIKEYEDHVEIVGCHGELVDIELPAEVSGLPVTVIAEGAFRFCSDLTSVILPDTITHIQDNAFGSCSSLSEINLPDSVVSIGQGAFECCSSLTDISFPSSLVSIGQEAFRDCFALSSIHIPASVTFIGECAFRNCTEMTRFSVDANNPNYSSDSRGMLFDKKNTTLLQVPATLSGTCFIPNNITRIGPAAFMGCDSMTAVSIPSSVTTIGNDAFTNCNKLTSITIPDGVSYIGDYAFESCTKLTRVTIPQSVTHIGTQVFSNCWKLTKIIVDEGNPNYSNDSRGVLFDKEKTKLIQAPGELSYTYTIPDGVIEIGEAAFDTCRELTDVTIANSVTVIGDLAFSYCTGLSTVIIPYGVTSIGFQSFSCCFALTSISIPASVTSIGEEAFSSCDNLPAIHVDNHNPNYSSDARGVLFDKAQETLIAAPGAITGSYTIPSSVTRLDPLAFHDCGRLTDITIPESVAYIGVFGFSGCGRLSIIRFEGDAPQMPIHLFENIKANAYYPINNPTWTNEVMEFCGPDLVWVPFNPDNPFRDVPIGSFYEKPVLWAVENGITSGATPTTFNPGGSCLRAHVVTFLWNAEKCPEPAAAASTFTDVPAGAWYEKPVLWAVENGITSGTSATKFGAGDVCSRYQVVFFLWKAAGSPEPKTTVNPFTDVNPGHFFYKAVLWAVENGITSGTSATTFGPTVPCNRAQVVTFLYAAYN